MIKVKLLNFDALMTLHQKEGIHLTEGKYVALFIGYQQHMQQMKKYDFMTNYL